MGSSCHEYYFNTAYYVPNVELVYVGKNTQVRKIAASELGWYIINHFTKAVLYSGLKTCNCFSLYVSDEGVSVRVEIFERICQRGLICLPFFPSTFRLQNFPFSLTHSLRFPTQLWESPPSSQCPSTMRSESFGTGGKEPWSYEQ